MNINIYKNITLNDIQTVFEGGIPDYHPTSYIESRMNDGMVFIAKNSNGDAIGFLIYNIWWGNCPFIELIKIREQYQRRGVGLKLLNNAKQELHAMGFTKLISSTEVINSLGLGFHDKANFKKLSAPLNLPHGEEQFYSVDI